jgi:predicted ArsR family transcriptional regulator
MQNMNEMSLTDLTAEIAVGARRAEVIEKLETAVTPLTVAQIATLTGLHVNTARFHLDALVGDGLANRSVEERATPGRPRILYSIRRGAAGPRSFGLLAEMLAGLVAALDGATDQAVRVGKAWGESLIDVSDRHPDSLPIDRRDALARLGKVLDSIGFQPEIKVTDQETIEILLHHCPFREVAERHTQIICAVHLGLMQGALSKLDAPLETNSLKPFVTPNICSAPIRVISTDPN